MGGIESESRQKFKPLVSCGGMGGGLRNAFSVERVGKQQHPCKSRRCSGVVDAIRAAGIDSAAIRAAVQPIWDEFLDMAGLPYCEGFDGNQKKLRYDRSMEEYKFAFVSLSVFVAFGECLDDCCKVLSKGLDKEHRRKFQPWGLRFAQALSGALFLKRGPGRNRSKRRQTPLLKLLMEHGVVACEDQLEREALRAMHNFSADTQKDGIKERLLSKRKKMWGGVR